MTNATSIKYNNIYTVNRNYNPIFDKWIDDNYAVTVSTAVWSYGSETFVNRITNERIYSVAQIMMKYVKSKMPYFKDFDELDKWLDDGCPTLS